jgi:DNA-directed RNA polymerase specialized sigma24 family protein
MEQTIGEYRTVGGDVEQVAERLGFEAFVAVRGQSLQRTAYLLTASWDSAEELLQTALGRAYPRWKRLERDDPESFILRTLVTSWSSRWRRDDRRRIGAEIDLDEGIATALGRLPRRQHALVVLRYYSGLTEAQIAATLDVSVASVRSQLSKARQALGVEAGVAIVGDDVVRIEIADA